MSIHGWQVIMWSRVALKPRDLVKLTRRFTHHGTSLQLGRSGGHRSGTTTWCCEYMEQRLGLVWEWVAVSPALIALANPMVVVSNVDLLNDHDQEVDSSLRLTSLHRVIYNLAWQQHIVSAHWQAAPEQRLLIANG